MKQKFNVTGMTCSACSAHVEKAVRQVEGVDSVSVNLLGNSMLVEYGGKTGPEQIIQAVTDAGYGASLPGPAGKAAPAARPADAMEEELAGMKRRFLTSLVFLAPLFYIAMGHMMGWPLPALFHQPSNALVVAFLQFLLTLPILYINDKYYKVGFKTLWHRAPNMDSLIAVGSAAAVIYGVFAIYQMGYGLGHGDMELVERYHMDLYFESAGMILTLITLGKFLETRSKGKTTDALKSLMKLAPQTACVLRDGEQVTVPVSEVNVGDLFLVRPGESIPVDGTVAEGISTVNEAALTGESMPVDKFPGSPVSAATINQNGALTCRAERVGQDTTLSQVIRLVRDAAATKAPLAKTADKVSGIFVPTVICIATATFLIWLLLGQTFTFALARGISVLVISCPCALGLATPVAIMVGSGVGAKNGILFKTAASLETTGYTDTVLLDKTGTVTTGEPSVVKIVGTGNVPEKFLLSLAAGLELRSEHPLARAILERADKDKLSYTTVADFEAVPGKGLQGKVAGKVIAGGNANFIREHCELPDDLTQAGDAMSADGITPLYFSLAGKAAGVIGVADVVKKTSKSAIDQMKALGLKVVLLTGDNAATARHIGATIGLDADHVIAGVLPAGKEAEVRALQAQGRVAMVGDGINDAPALTRAETGIAIGAGADVALDAADVVLVRSDLADVPAAVRLSRAVVRNIHQNLFWAFFYNAICIPLAAGVFTGIGITLNPMIASAAMSLSSVCVVTNALRLNAFDPRNAAHDAPPKRKAPARKPISEPTTCPTGSCPVQPAEINDKTEEITMNKTIHIEGMMCGHCEAAVKKALEALDGVAGATVSHEQGTAIVALTHDVADAELKAAVEAKDYTVTGIDA